MESNGSVSSTENGGVSNVEKFLCERLVDQSQPISERFRALFSLRNLKGPGPRNALILASRDSSNLLAHEAAFALGQMQDAEAIPALKSVLNDMSLHPIVRHEAAEALGGCISLVFSEMEWTRGRILGRGSTATVYSATYNNSDEILAVKSSEFHRSEFLQREAKILSSLNSSYVIGYRGSETKRDSNGVVTYNLLMEYAPYGTLTDAAAKNGGGLEETQVVKYTRQILRGLEYIHSVGIAHCDIKGRNVVVSENGEAKIADFGCAKREFDSPVVGTPAFMAPEVARGEKQGKESDIWAVGCTVIEMVTGSLPWSEANEDPVSVLYRVGYSGETPEVPCLLTEQAKDFLEKCLKREAKERWNATQLLNHPFLITKPDIEPGLVSGFLSSSPTSVTDQTFWRSAEEEEEEETEELQEASRDQDRLSSWGCERIGRLRCVHVLDGARWDMEGGDWITVRVKCEGTMISGSH